MEQAHGFRAGTVAIVGRPNVGKSTLLNRLVGQKISITSRRPQTTRHRVLGIVTRADAQFVFVDTPGLQASHATALNRAMNRAVAESLQPVDAVTGHRGAALRPRGQARAGAAPGTPGSRLP